MILDTFCEEDTEVVFSYLPVWEMFFSMHVLSEPEHHISRKNWIEAKEREFPELVHRIKELRAATVSWSMIIDSDKWSEVRQMEIGEMISFFRQKNIYQWNEWIEFTGRTMSIKERDNILEVIEQYYHKIFRKEEVLLRVYISRILQEEREKCQKKGLWAWCEKVHPRLLIETSAVVFLKNREYRFEKKEISRVHVTVSTFVSPHLWLWKNNNELEIVKGIEVEQIKNEIPEDLVLVFKALGHSTRLQIIKYLLQGICTTQALAQKMLLSEPAISKHLRILESARLVKKTKKGLYMEYSFKTDKIDYIPYAFYEIMLQKQ